MATQESATCMPALVWGDVSGRPTFAAWLSEYEKIGNDYLESLKACGIDFASRGADAAERQAVRCRLAEKGASMRLGGASVSCGPLSSACMACAADAGSRTFFLSLACNRHCYFCFNRNQEDFEAHRHLKCDWRDELDEFLDGPVPATHIALTGGEPLLHADEAVAFIERAHRKAQNCHVRLYTDGDFLNEALLARLRDAGLTELRLSIKPDEPDAVAEACDRLALAKEFIPQVMVEMPVIPGTDEEMQQLLLKLDDLGIFGFNLLEFGYPMRNWEPFAKRGFRIAAVRNCLQLHLCGRPSCRGKRACVPSPGGIRARRELKIGVHYCSLENKTVCKCTSKIRRLVWTSVFGNSTGKTSSGKRRRCLTAILRKPRGFCRRLARHGPPTRSRHPFNFIRNTRARWRPRLMLPLWQFHTTPWSVALKGFSCASWGFSRLASKRGASARAILG